MEASALIKEAAGGKGIASEFSVKIGGALRDDVGTPQALALLWEALGSSSLTPAEKWEAVTTADEVLGLSLMNPPETPKALPAAELPSELSALALRREEARKAKDFAASDELRVHFEERGYRVDDTPSGTTYTKIVR